MNNKKIFSLYGDSSFFGRPYKINRLLFLFASLIVLAFILFLVTNGTKYGFVECAPDVEDKCLNVLFGSERCSKADIKDLPICTSEYIIVNGSMVDKAHPHGTGRIGNYPPFIVRNYTLSMLLLFVITLLINTALHNRQMFTKAYWVEFRESIEKIELDDEGKNESNNNKAVNTKGEGSNSSVREGGSGQSGFRGDKREDGGEEAKLVSEDSFEERKQSNDLKTRVSSRHKRGEWRIKHRNKSEGNREDKVGDGGSVNVDSAES